MKNLKELNSKEIGMLVVMCKADGTPIKMNNGKYVAVAYDSDKSDAENVKACKDFARENKIGEGAISKAKFKKMKETKLSEDLEFMPNSKGAVTVKHVVDGYRSNVTKDKTKEPDVVKNLKPATSSDVHLAKAVLKDLEKKGKESDVTKKCNLDPKPDVVIKGNGDVEINPDNGKASYTLPAKELKKFEEAADEDKLYLEFTEKGKEKFFCTDEYGNPCDVEMSKHFDSELINKYFFDHWADVYSSPEDGPEADEFEASGIFETTPELFAEMIENDPYVELDDFIVGLGFTETTEEGMYGPEEVFHVTDVIDDIYSIWGAEEPEMDESVITNKKDLKESEGTYLRTFFKFDDMLDEDGELKQVDEVTDWLQELIDCNYLENMWGVWFEDYDDTAAAAGIAVKTMPEILAEDPEAQFGYSYGGPDTRLCLDNAVDYVQDDGCDDWEHFGIKSPYDDDYYDEDEDYDDEEYDLDESMKTFDGVCPYCGNPVGLDTTECGYCGFDLSDYDECQTSDVDYEGLSGKRFEESEETLAKNPFEDFFNGYEMVVKGMKNLKESELRTMNRNQALQFARQNRMPGAAFSSNSPMEIKKGLQMMKSQLHDMLANRGRYELALQQGFVVAGFGGNLNGIEVPETLMTGELPAGTTPEQAFDQVVDFMRKTIANLTIKLAKAGKDPTALPKQPTKYLESKSLREKIGVKGHFGIQVRLGGKNGKGDDYLTQILGENGIPAEDAEPFEKATKKEVEASSMYKNAIKKYGKDNVTIIKF